MYFLYVVPENNVRQSLQLYPDATLVLEDSARYGADMYHKSLYYWTQAPIETVQQHYEQFFHSFIATGDKYGSWLMTAYHLDGLYPEPDTDSTFLGHGSFCPDFHDERCVTISLVDAHQPDLYRLAISSPSSFYRDTPPPEFANIPLRGTVIIYSYWKAGA